MSTIEAEAPASVILPAHVIEDDHRLEHASSDASRKLMEHRWHWTLDKKNPGRVGLRAYAKQLGKTLPTIQRYAHGWEILSDTAGGVTPTEALERAGMGAETQAATEAVAKAHEVAFKTAREDHGPEVRRVRQMAREAAERKGTSVEEEAPRAAKVVYNATQAEKTHEARQRERYGLAYIKAELEGDKARRHLLAMTKVMNGANFDHEERELLIHTLDSLRRLLDLMDRAIAGHIDNRWHDELRVVEGGQS